MEFEQTLQHYGVKGMKWGKRKAASVDISEDAKRASEALTKVKKAKTTKVLSNKELQDVVTRINLEQQYARLNPKSNPMVKGQKIAKEVLNVGSTVNNAIAFANSPAGKALQKQLSAKK